MGKNNFVISTIIFVAALLLSACSQVDKVTVQSNEPVTIRMAVLPILETLPMYVAQNEGLFGPIFTPPHP